MKIRIRMRIRAWVRVRVCSLTTSWISLALSEASLIFARMLWEFDLCLAEESLDWAEQRAFIIWDKGPLWVRIQPRG